MQVNNHGKYTKMSKRYPRGIARCDYSGLMVRQASMKRQYEYRGTGLVWTGFMVNPKFSDVPNPQNLTPLIKADPVPIVNTRPDNIIDAQTTLPTSTGAITIDVSGSQNVTLTESQFDNGSITFTGVLGANIIIILPANYNQFYANNLTTGGFTLGMQIFNNNDFVLNIPPASPTTLLGPLVVNTSLGLQIVYF
jgi:hypothetical protein